MINLRECQNKNEWDDYILDNGGHPLQLWGWGSLKSAHGWQVERLFCYDETDLIIGSAQVLIRKLPMPFRSLCYIPRYLIKTGDKSEEILKTIANHVKRKYHSVLLKVEPDSENFEIDGFMATSNYILPSKTIILDLLKTDSELMADMAKKTRQYIRKSINEVGEIRLVKSRDELKDCLDLYHQTADRANFSLHNDEYYDDVFDKLGEFSQLFAAFIDGKPIAFLWLTISGETAFELYGGMNEVGQKLRANYALKWYAVLKCKDWGLSRYDFGGIIDGGVGVFKKNWASQEVDLAGSFDMPLSSFYKLWEKGLPKAKKAIRRLKSLTK